MKILDLFAVVAMFAVFGSVGAVEVGEASLLRGTIKAFFSLIVFFLCAGRAGWFRAEARGSKHQKTRGFN